MKSLIYNTALQRINPIGLFVLLGGCNVGGVTSPELHAALGLYVLAQVDGAPLPSPPAAPGSADPCPQAITDGELSLNEGPRTPQGYVLSVVKTRACDPDGIPVNVTPVATDAGLWSMNGSKISFTSSPYNRNGSYQGTVQTVSPIPIVSVQFSGHEYTFRRLDQRELPGYVSVSVTDQERGESQI